MFEPRPRGTNRIPLPEKERLVAVYLQVERHPAHLDPSEFRYKAVFAPTRWVTTRPDHYPILVVESFSGRAWYEEGPLGEHLGTKIPWSALPPRVARRIVKELDYIPVEGR